MSMPTDLFSKMSLLSTLHFGNHYNLTKLPLFEGLTNLKSVTLAGVGMTELPSFEPLKKLRRMEIMSSTGIERFPSLAPLQNLIYLVITRVGACCDEATNTCSDATCANALCVGTGAGDGVDATSVAILEKFNNTVCPAMTGGGPLPSSNLTAGIEEKKADIAVCGGVLYRQCNMAEASENSTVAMCYNDMMQVISCTSKAINIVIRKLQIQQSTGLPCDPVEEKWLGCPVIP